MVLADVDGNGNTSCVDFMEKRLRLAALVRAPEAGRQMQVFTSAPGVQFYTGNFLDNGTMALPMTQHSGFCLETQLFPDAINHAEWRESCILKPGQRYEVTTLHRFDNQFAFP
jgi:aldose 1-epimerase